MRLLYNILSYMSIPFLLIRLWVKSCRYKAYRCRWKERLGYVVHQPQGSIWFHAVSLGESIASIPLITRIMNENPGVRVVVTNMTPTGSEQIQKVFGDEVYNCYLPYDIPHFMKRFFKRIQPRAAILMETELWPNALTQCARRKIPVILANARLSQRSAAGYRRFSGLVKQMLAQLTLVLAQTKDDGDRFVSLGLPKDRLRITGSMKFDLNVAEEVIEKGAALRKKIGARLVWIAGSTHDSEEELMLRVHRRLLETIPNLLLILVPRHPNRFDKVADLVSQVGCTMARRSLQQSIGDHVSVYLGDTLGEMLLLFAASDVAFVGGSFTSTGGHNVLEPAALSKPILVGPTYHNFLQITEKLEEMNALKICETEQVFQQELLRLLKDKVLRDKMGSQALAVVDENKGSLQKQFELIQDYISH